MLRAIARRKFLTPSQCLQVRPSAKRFIATTCDHQDTDLVVLLCSHQRVSYPQGNGCIDRVARLRAVDSYEKYVINLLDKNFRLHRTHLSSISLALRASTRPLSVRTGFSSATSNLFAPAVIARHSDEESARIV
jgi:hypothetical protein